jgi:hypothetical protein
MPGGPAPRPPGAPAQPGHPAPDPVAVRAASRAALHRLRLPAPADGFPLVWDAGDTVALRPRTEIEARIAVLNVVLARCFGMPRDAALDWLRGAGLDGHLTGAERAYVVDGAGEDLVFALHLDAVHALVWVLGLSGDLDPCRPPADGLMARLPDLPGEESYARWQARILAAPRAAADAAAWLDLYYCLDWAFLEAERQRQPLPGLIDSNAIGQRRWALEWAVVLAGPHHDPPPAWDEVDLT